MKCLCVCVYVCMKEGYKLMQTPYSQRVKSKCTSSHDHFINFVYVVHSKMLERANSIIKMLFKFYSDNTEQQIFINFLFLNK